jgi:hypothetical protein
MLVGGSSSIRFRTEAKIQGLIVNSRAPSERRVCEFATQGIALLSLGLCSSGPLGRES